MAPHDGGPSLGSQIVMALLPLGGLMANLVEMYADESFDGTETGPLCLAIYLYERDQGAAATDEWVAVLNDPDLPRPLKYFRMSDCAHGTGEFEGMKEHCDRVARKMIPIPKARSIVGFAATVNQSEYKKIIPPSKGHPNAYTFLAHMCLSFVRSWVEKAGYSGHVLYNFEAGHKHRTDTERLMKEIEKGEHGHRHYCAGHSFTQKECMPLLQSADLLAWHSFTDLKKRAKGALMRADFAALARPQDKSQHWTAPQLQKAVEAIKRYDQLSDLIKTGVDVLRQAGFLKRGGGR